MTYRDAAVRVLMTALQAALGVLVASGAELLDVSVVRQAGVVALVAAVTAAHRFTEAWLAGRSSGRTG